MQETITGDRLKTVRTGLLVNALASLAPILALIIANIAIATSVATMSTAVNSWSTIAAVLLTPTLMFVGTLLIYRGINTPEVRKTIMPCCVLSALMVVAYLITAAIPQGTIGFALAFIPLVVGVTQVLAFMHCANTLYRYSDIRGMNRVYNSCVYMLISLALVAVGVFFSNLMPGGPGGIIIAVGACAIFSASIFWCIGWTQAWRSAKEPIEIDTDPEED